jgi:hypothetical protein
MRPRLDQSGRRSKQKPVIGVAPEATADAEVSAFLAGGQMLIDPAIARRAHEIYLARGGEHGHDVEDWVAAEREILLAAEGDASS